MKKKQPDKTAPVSETAQKTVSRHRSFHYLDDATDMDQALHFLSNHRALLWFSGAWGRSHQQALCKSFTLALLARFIPNSG
jgi:hypothetical protein